MTLQKGKVISRAAFRTSESSAFLTTLQKERAVLVGRREEGGSMGLGFLAKVVEHSGGANILDYAVWLDLNFPHVIGVFGTRGTGKSFDLGVIVESIAGLRGVSSEGAPSSATIVFDVQDQFWTLGHEPDPALEEDSVHLANLKAWAIDPAKVSDLVVWAPASVQTASAGTQTFRISPGQLRADDWLALLELERYSPMGQCLLTLLRR